MNNPFVSVIIPNYNHAPYLDQRIQSVLNQTYENFEVIILDDCSPDNGASKAVIEKYRSNPHVSNIVYNETNAGSPYKQWHKGAKLAKGELLWIAESDDYSDEHFLEVLVPSFSNNNVSVAFCRSILFNEKGIIGRSYPADIEERVYRGEEFIRKYCIMKTGIVNASSAIFTKDSFLSISDIYTTFKGAADKLFWVLIAEKGDIAFVEKPYNYFRQHSDSTSAMLTMTGFNQIEDIKFYNYLCEKGHILKDEEYKVKYEFIRTKVFERLTDYAVKHKVYKAWGWGIKDQILMRLRIFVEKHITN